MTEENNKPEEFVPEFNVADTNKTVKMKTEFDYSHVNERGFIPGKFIFARIVKEQPDLPTVLQPITDPDVPGCTVDLPEFIHAPGDTNKEMIRKHFIDHDVHSMYMTPVRLFSADSVFANRRGFDVESTNEFLGNWIKDADPMSKENCPNSGFVIPPLNRYTRKLLENACVSHHQCKRSDARAEIQRANAKLVANWKKKGKQNTRRRTNYVVVDFHIDHLSFNLLYKGKNALFFNLY